MKKEYNDEDNGLFYEKSEKFYGWCQDKRKTQIERIVEEKGMEDGKYEKKK